MDFVHQDPSKPGCVVKVSLPRPEACTVDQFSGKPQALGQIFHFVLTVQDDGFPRMTTYKRVIVQITNKALLGHKARVETIVDVQFFS